MGACMSVDRPIISVSLFAQGGERTSLREGDEIVFWSDTWSSTSMRVEREGSLCLFGDRSDNSAGYVIAREAYKNHCETVRMNAREMAKVISVLTGFALKRTVDEDEKQVFVVLAAQ